VDVALLLGITTSMAWGNPLKTVSSIVQLKSLSQWGLLPAKVIGKIVQKRVISPAQAGGCLGGAYQGYRDKYAGRLHIYKDPLFHYEYYRKSAYGRGHKRGYYQGYQDSFDSGPPSTRIRPLRQVPGKTAMLGATGWITPRASRKANTSRRTRLRR
jgi:hypothetical protein